MDTRNDKQARALLCIFSTIVNYVSTGGFSEGSTLLSFLSVMHDGTYQAH